MRCGKRRHSVLGEGHVEDSPAVLVRSFASVGRDPYGDIMLFLTKIFGMISSSDELNDVNK